MLSYKDQLSDLATQYKTWLSNKIEPMVEYPTPWMQDNKYSLNSDGLRCDEFFEISKNDHILFAGCEYTLPIDYDLEHSWAFNIYRYFLGRNDTYRNLSYPGADPEKIVSNIIKYIDTYGAPKKIFVLMPEIIRSYGYWPEGKVFKPKMYRQLQSENGKEHNDMAKPNNVPIQKLSLSYIRWCWALESYCKAINSELYWSTWDKETSNILITLGFNNFFETENNLLDQNEIYSHFVKKIKENNGI